MQNDFSQEQWDRKVVELGGSILQAWIWGQFQQNLGYKVYRFSDTDFLNLVVELPLPMSKKYLYSSRGPLGEPESALSDLKKFSADKSFVFARIEPQQKMNLPLAAKMVQPKNNWLLDLEKSEQELLIGMKPKTRYNINLAQRKKLLFREGTKQDLLAFYQLLLETAARNGFRLHPQSYYWQAWETMSPKYLKLLLVEYQGRLLAGMLLTLFADTATYLHGGSSAHLKQAMAPYLLHWEAIKLAKSSGLKFYDFGGVASEQLHAWAGLSRFKKSFGGFEVEYPGTYDLVFSPIWYNVYKNARKLRAVFRK